MNHFIRLLLLSSVFVSGAVRSQAQSTGVGIGTATPATSLHVKGTGDQEISIESSSTGGRRWTLQSNPAATGLNTSFQIIDRSATASRLGIDSLGRVGIGTTAPAASAALDVSSTNRGFLPPRMTAAQRTQNIATPTAGLMVYQTDSFAGYYYHNGSDWMPLSTAILTRVAHFATANSLSMPEYATPMNPGVESQLRNNVFYVPANTKLTIYATAPVGTNNIDITLYPVVYSNFMASASFASPLASISLSGNGVTQTLTYTTGSSSAYLTLVLYTGAGTTVFTAMTLSN